MYTYLVQYQVQVHEVLILVVQKNRRIREATKLRHHHQDFKPLIHFVKWSCKRKRNRFEHHDHSQVTSCSYATTTGDPMFVCQRLLPSCQWHASASSQIGRTCLSGGGGFALGNYGCNWTVVFVVKVRTDCTVSTGARRRFVGSVVFWNDQENRLLTVYTSHPHLPAGPVLLFFGIAEVVVVVTEATPTAASGLGVLTSPTFCSPVWRCAAQ